MAGTTFNLAMSFANLSVAYLLVGCVPVVLYSSRLVPRDWFSGARPYNPRALGFETVSASVAPVVDDHLNVLGSVNVAANKMPGIAVANHARGV